MTCIIVRKFWNGPKGGPWLKSRDSSSFLLKAMFRLIWFTLSMTPTVDSRSKLNAAESLDSQQFMTLPLPDSLTSGRKVDMLLS